MRFKTHILALLLVFISANLLFAQFTNGIKFLADNKIDEAIAEFEKKLPDDENNLIYLAYCYYLRGKNEKAKEILVDNASLFSQLCLADIYYQEGDLSSAKPLYEKILSENAGIQMVHARLYELLKAENPSLAQTHYVMVFQLPNTELKDFLPKIENITYEVPKKENIYIASQKLDSADKTNLLPGFMSRTNTASVSNTEIIISVKGGGNIIRSVGTIFNDISNDFLIEKLTEFIIIGIFLLILFAIRQKEEQRIKNIVLNNYRLSKIGGPK